MTEWGAPVTLVGESSEQVAAAQRELARIGIDALAGAATGEPGDLATAPDRLRRTLTASYQDLAEALQGRPGELPAADVVLDVRTHNEYRAAHVEGAVHIPLYELAGRVGEIPDGSVRVHCGSGYRAVAAASVLERAGRAAVVLDGHFDTAAAAGIQLTVG